MDLAFKGNELVLLGGGEGSNNRDKSLSLLIER